MKALHHTPPHCLYCDNIIEYQKRRNKFCNNSCSASYNNARRNRKFLTPVDSRSFCQVTFNICLGCHAAYRSTGNDRGFCLTVCNPEFYTKSAYRTRCRFTLNNVSHPTLYNGDLIATHGWYNPTNKKGDTNLIGVCWDHLYRVEDGYSNNVNPTMMSHPANAELVTWSTNKARRKSMITYKELLDRIVMWDAGVHDLPTFI